ncbi:MAG: spheroidene monooxygenase [Paracoccaceae bacterium]
MQAVSLSFFRFSSPVARLWALAQMGAARFSLPHTPEIGFWKLLGSGTGEGFTPIPNTSVYAILATWPSLEAAQTQTANAPTFQRYQHRATEHWTVFLNTSSVRGNWSHTDPFNAEAGSPDRGHEAGPLAALTRATIKPSIALKFWERVPAISNVIGEDPNVIFKIGVGEVPLLHQVTFSIWPDAQSMANFARKDGPHARAIRAVRDGEWFAEELYARFRILGSAGTWHGSDPLENLPLSEMSQ